MYPSQTKEARRKYYETHKEQFAASAKKWYEKNTERERIYRKKWERTHKEQRKAQKLRKHFGISLEEYEAMKLAQNNLCYLCGEPETKKHQSGEVLSLSVDHNHANGAVRKLLCWRCNMFVWHVEVVDARPDFASKVRKYIDSVLL